MYLSCRGRADKKSIHELSGTCYKNTPIAMQGCNGIMFVDVVSDPAEQVGTSTQYAGVSRRLVKSGVEFVRKIWTCKVLRALAERQGNDNLRFRSQECINVHILPRE